MSTEQGTQAIIWPRYCDECGGKSPIHAEDCPKQNTQPACTCDPVHSEGHYDYCPRSIEGITRAANEKAKQIMRDYPPPPETGAVDKIIARLLNSIRDLYCRPQGFTWEELAPVVQSKIKPLTARIAQLEQECKAWEQSTQPIHTLMAENERLKEDRDEFELKYLAAKGQLETVVARVKGLEGVGCGWIYFSTRPPTEEDLPFVTLASDGVFAIFTQSLSSSGWSKDWIAWRSIGPLPKPVDEGEKAWVEWHSMQGGEYNLPSYRIAWLAGYAAGFNYRTLK